jgi:hypothetical protein
MEIGYCWDMISWNFWAGIQNTNIQGRLCIGMVGFKRELKSST